MMDTLKQSLSKELLSAKQRTYADIVEFLDKRWHVKQNSQTIERMKVLDKALQSPSKKINTILVAGTNGKSLTINFTTQLLRAEGLKVGSFYSPHTLTYNERFAVNSETITNKAFVEVINEIIAAAEELAIEPGAQELLAMAALKYFADQGVDVAVLEVNEGGTFNPVNICNAHVATITRVTPCDTDTDEVKLQAGIEDVMGIVKQGTHVVSGDQNKGHLQRMHQLADKAKGLWAMPIRKLATLTYPFEQLHGRCAALAERTAQIYAEHALGKDATVVSDSLLIKPKGQRGRPTLDEKRRSELYPRKTLEQFWKETTNQLPSRFQLLDKEKPSILLDNASNIDAFKNLLLGIRLLHYQRPLKGLTIVIGAAKKSLYSEEFLKMIRYFFKKTSGQLIVCPLDETLPRVGEGTSWDAEQVANDAKSMKVKARACASFEEAFDAAKKSVDERNGLVVITGSQSIIHQYWKHKGIKKF